MPRNADDQFTHANISLAQRELGYKPTTDLQTGLKKLVRRSSEDSFDIPKNHRILQFFIRWWTIYVYSSVWTLFNLDKSKWNTKSLVSSSLLTLNKKFNGIRSKWLMSESNKWLWEWACMLSKRMYVVGQKKKNDQIRFLQNDIYFLFFKENVRSCNGPCTDDNSSYNGDNIFAVRQC